MELDWKEYKRIIDSGKAKKFDKRNIPFKEKDLLFIKAQNSIVNFDGK